MGMKKLFVIVALVHAALGASIVDVTCPDSCACQVKDEYLETSCTSYEFIKKLLPKQIATVVRLNINNASLVNVDAKLWKLKNINHLDLSNNQITSLPTIFPYLPKLQTLNLSANHLKEVAVENFPKNLQVVDLSQNSISNFPKNLVSLKQLKTLYFGGNPVDCDWYNLNVYEQLVSGGVNVLEKLTCSSPKEFYGRTLDSVNSSIITDNLLNDSMLGDEGGSGDEDVNSNRESAELLGDELIPTDSRQSQSQQDELEEEEEGSGVEGSGYEIPILPIIPVEKVLPDLLHPCNFNCSTPKPVGSEDSHGAADPPHFKEGVQIIFEDVLNMNPSNEAPKNNKDKDNDDASVTTQATLLENFHAKEEDFDHGSDKNLVETFPTNTTVLGEMERASLHDSNSNSVYVIIGLLVAFVCFAAIYLVKKRNQKRDATNRRNKSKENGYGEELKPLGKSAEKPQISKIPEKYQKEKAPIVETAPLINGQNGKIADDLKPQLDNNFDNESEADVVLRNHDTSDLLLTPQPERVTIKVGEIPDSVPKTPMLVHRQMNTEGEFITTAIIPN